MKLFLAMSISVFTVKAFSCIGPIPQGQKAQDFFNTAIVDMLKSTQIPVAPVQMSLSNVRFNGGTRGDCKAVSVIGDLKVEYRIDSKTCIYEATLSALYSTSLGNEVYVQNLNRNECN